MPQNDATTAGLVGQGELVYRPVPDWDQRPEGWSYLDVAAGGVDSRGQVYVFNRGEHPLIVYDSQGRFLRAWGEGLFVRAHGLTIGPDDSIYLTDDLDHTVRKYTPDGELLMTLGASGQPSDTGVVNFDYRTIRQAAGPFHYPTNLALSATGEMYVSDGYGNARVHKFSPEGELLFSWGEPGSGPGQFHLPHGIAVDRTGRVLVADRENDRIQVFDAEGGFLEEWTDIVRPCEVFVDEQDRVFVAEVGRRCGLFPWMAVDPGTVGGRVSVLNRQGRVLSRWGGGENPLSPGDFYAPHDIWLDREGSVYVGEVTWAAGGNRGMAPPDCPSLRKFVRVSA